MEATKIENFRSEASLQSLGLSHPDIYSKALELIHSNGMSKGNLLDVGAGKGDFLKYIQPLVNYKLHGVDLMHTKMSNTEWYVQDLNQVLQFQNQKFDAISCLEVLEHIENPRQLVREMFRVLKPGGILVVSTPNNHSWRAIISYIFREHFVAFTDSSYPAHITALNKTDLKRMFCEAGFEDCNIDYSNKGSLPKWTSMTWQKISSGLFQGARYSDNVFCSAKKP